jgi:hypothetical protein
VAAGSPAPHPGCLQWRAPSVAGEPGSGIWSGIWLVMAESFLFLFRSGRRKEMRRKSGDE